MKVLFASSMALFPGTGFGGAKRLYYLARELARHCELHLICLDGCREWPPGAPPPAEFPRSLYLNLGGRKPAWRRLASPSIEIAEDMARLRPALDRFLGDTRFDATLAAFPLALNITGPDAPDRFGRFAYLEDDLLLESYRNGARRGKAAARALNAWRHRQALAWFRARLRKASAFVAISEEERGKAQGYFPGLPGRILKYGLPLEEFPCLPPGDPTVLGFLGNYSHGPNLDAGLWLARELAPALARSQPGLRIRIAGRAMPDSLQAACAASPGVEADGDVADLAAWYRGIGLFINPIREGRGLRTKVVEAAAFGRPVVSTPLGAEGLEDLDIPTWTDADSLARLLAEAGKPARYRSLSEGNRRAVEERYSLAALGRELLGILKA